MAVYTVRFTLSSEDQVNGCTLLHLGNLYNAWPIVAIVCRYSSIRFDAALNTLQF